VYDAAGMRVATKLYDVWQFFIYDAFGKKVAEYGGLQAADEGGVKYMLSDWQGSTRAVLNNTGVVNARMDYTAFGEEINSGIGQRTTQQGFGANNNLRNKYALTERDEATGLDHTWFRKNESKAGRWTSPDPYNGSMSLGNPQSFNRYSYVENQPTNFVDPSGLLAEGEICQINGQVDSKGDPVYQGTVRNGRCESHAGSPVVISAGGWGWIGGSTYTPYNPFNSSGPGGGGTGIDGGGIASAGNPPGQLPPLPEPPKTKPFVEVPTQKPVSNLDPSNPKLPPNPTLVQRIKFAVVIAVRVLGKYIGNIPIMLDPAVICEEARKEGSVLGQTPLCISPVTMAAPGRIP
jgi:RHS repeat-associated protein